MKNSNSVTTFLTCYNTEYLKKEQYLKDKNESFCLKVYGKDEYLVKNCPLIAYSTLQEDLKIHGKIFLVIKKIDDVIMRILPIKMLKLKRGLQRANTFAFEKSLETKKLRSNVKLSSLDINDKFRIEIGQLKFDQNFNINSDTETWMRYYINTNKFLYFTYIKHLEFQFIMELLS